jgi:hypothetical protein
MSTATNGAGPVRAAATRIDSRGPRFGAALTAVLLLVAILLGPGAGTVVLAVVVLSFALGTARGVQGTWQGLVFRRLVQPRLTRPAELEAPEPPRFAQLVGLLITGVGLVLTLLGVAWALPVLGVVALAAAALNAIAGFCLGCEMYLVLLRARRRLSAAPR